MGPRHKFLNEILTKCRPDINFYMKSVPKRSQKGSEGTVETFTFRGYLPEATFASAESRTQVAIDPGANKNLENQRSRGTMPLPSISMP